MAKKVGRKVKKEKAEKTLQFVLSSNKKAIKKIYDHNISAFSDTPDFEWNLQALNNEIKDGWDLYSVELDDDVVAALFMKIEGNILYTKNSAIKMVYQGNEFSHRIKEFFEEYGKKNKLKKIVSFCKRDNFRMIALNESHGYKRTSEQGESPEDLEEWTKILS